jgi:signal transduction histidine kinase
VVNGAVVLVVLCALAIYTVAPNELVANVCYLGVLVGAGVGAWIGAARAPRERRLVPVLIAIGVSLSALGDVLWTVLDQLGSGTDVSVADPPWFASYVALCLALWLVLKRTRPSTSGGRRADLNLTLDVVTIVVVSVLIFWSVSIDAIVADHSVSPFVRAVWAAYPVADAILLALVVRVMMSRSARATVGASFAVGVGLWLAADIAYLQAPDASNAGVFLDAAWMVGPVLMARAAWRAGDVGTETVDTSPRGGWVGQLLVAVAPLLVPAALELVADVRGQDDQPVQLFVGTALLITLTFVRTARLLRSEARALRELESARDAALRASEAKTLFVANMSHEIRTPLTTVLATGELLEDTPLDSVQLELVTKMNRSGGLLMSLVEGILDFSRIEAGQLGLTSRAFDLHAMVADVADVYRSRAIPAGVTFACHVDTTVPRTVVGDPARVFQVLSNLLDNALKFTDDGEVRLDVRRVDAVPAGDSVGHDVEFMVSDTGIGLREEDQKLIFESFHQVDGSTTRRHGGNGLGLAICKELVELQGGSITVQSQFGIGSTFVVRLPLREDTSGPLLIQTLRASLPGPQVAGRHRP